MRPDVDDLQTFYGSRQGLLVRRLVGRQIRVLWPDLRGLRVLGLGYAVPFLAPLSEGAERVCVIMPRVQGGMRWPPDQPNQVALACEDELPLADRSIDRVLMVHALESADQVQRLLREVWRVRADGGEALIEVPNRRGLWSLSEATPFGQGRPYSPSQLKEVLCNTLFTPRQSAPALFVPPSRSRVLLRTAVAWERIGLRWAKHFAGVLLMRAEKQIYAAPVEPALTRRRMPAYVPLPHAAATAERVCGPPEPRNRSQRSGA
ncbi:MAG: methyltransferase domain-containing protein [Geminicoccaceae bacterium]